MYETQPTIHLAEHELWRMPTVERVTGYRRSRIYEMVAEGQFPHPVKLGPRASAWVSTEIQAWIAERIAERDQVKGVI